MYTNPTIIVGTVLLVVGGAYIVVVMRQGSHNYTKVVVGGYLLAITAGLIDLVSPEAGHVAGLLIMLAVGTLAFLIIPDLFSRISKRGA